MIRRKPNELIAKITRRSRLALLTMMLIWIGAMLAMIGVVMAVRPVASEDMPAAAPASDELPFALPAQSAITHTPAPTVPPTAHPVKATKETMPPHSLYKLPTPTATVTPSPTPAVPPSRIVIPAIGLDAPVKPVSLVTFQQDGNTYGEWDTPNEFAAGWFNTSAAPGQKGNMVLDGHHNEYGEVFRYLVNLNVGDKITIYAGNEVYTYAIRQKMILPERDQPLSVRLANAQWIQPTHDERLTLVTCWPYTNNTHRLIIVAMPVASAPAQ